MSFFSPPSAPNPMQVANTQNLYNQQAAQEQQRLNMIGQQTPYSRLAWNVDPNAPGGYSATQTLTPEQQNLLNIQQTGQAAQGGLNQQLTGNLAGLYSQPANLNPQAITNQLMKWQQAYVNPIFGQQQSNLNSQLYNQGLTPGSDAYNNAQNLLARNQGDVTNQFLMQAEPQAFQQAVQSYQVPIQTALAGLAGTSGGLSGPGGPGYVQTPTEQIQPPNYTGAAYNTFAAQQQQYQNMMSGLGQLFGAGTNFLFPQGVKAGMFGGGWGGGGG